MYAIVEAASGMVIEVCLTQEGAKRFVQDRLDNSTRYAIREISVDQALEFLRDKGRDEQ